jgi:hypothetical protein
MKEIASMQRFILCASLSVVFVVVRATSSFGADNLLEPTKDHEGLAHAVGQWDADITMWEKPGAEPMKSKGTEKCEMFGKFWLMSEFESDFGGQPFKGRSALGYDPVKKKIVGGWIDTMSPFMMKMEGDYDPETKTATVMGDSTDPMTGKPAKYKLVTKHEGPDAKTFTMYHLGDGGAEDWQKMMEIKYTRKK